MFIYRSNRFDLGLVDMLNLYEASPYCDAHGEGLIADGFFIVRI